MYKKGDTYYVFEAKGGGSALGGKQVNEFNPATRKAHFGQQGTRQYLEKTIEDMAKSSDKLKNKAARELEEALEKGNVKYIVAEQKLTKTGEIGEFIVKEFDIK